MELTIFCHGVEKTLLFLLGLRAAERRIVTYPRSVVSSDSCLLASFFKAVEYCSSIRRRSYIRVVSIKPAQHGIKFVYLEPVRNVRVKLFRMLHSIIEIGR